MTKNNNPAFTYEIIRTPNEPLKADSGGLVSLLIESDKLAHEEDIHLEDLNEMENINTMRRIVEEINKEPLTTFSATNIP